MATADVMMPPNYKMELDQINEYQVFIDHGIAKYDPKSKLVMNAPQGYQKIKVHLVFACKSNGCHNRWDDATKKELDQINKYQVFNDHGIAKYDPKSKWITNAPQGNQKIKVHLVFACKHDGYHKARVVAGGHLTPDPIDSIYSGVG